MAYPSHLEGEEQRIEKLNENPKSSGDDFSPCFCPRDKINSAHRPYGDPFPLIVGVTAWTGRSSPRLAYTLTRRAAGSTGCGPLCTFGFIGFHFAGKTTQRGFDWNYV
jgi:hypothetical protein